MNISVVYICWRAAYRIVDFLHRWYVDAPRGFLHRFMTVLESLDRTFALKVTLRHFFEPLYKDYTVVGRILGIVFRSGRVLIAGLTYLAASIAYGVLFLAWLLVPFLLLMFIVLHFPA